MRSKLLVGFLALIVLCSQAMAYISFDEAQKDEPAERPPLKFKKIVFECLAGFGTGYGGAIIGGLGGGGGGGGGKLNYGGAIGAIVGYVIGIPLGVWLVGDDRNETGSYLMTLGGSILGSFATLMTLSKASDEFWAFGVFIPVFCSTAAFNMTLRYKPGKQVSALADYNNGRLTFHLPQIFLRPSPFRTGTLCLNMDLVNITL